MRYLFTNKRILVASIFFIILLIISGLYFLLKPAREYKITVNTSPQGAFVTINSITQKTPATFSLKKGDYDLQISLSDYKTIQSSFSVTKDKSGFYNLEAISANSNDESALESFLKKLPIRKEGFTIAKNGSSLFISIDKGPVETYKIQAEKYLKNQKLDLNTIEIIWNVPAYLR